MSTLKTVCLKPDCSVRLTKQSLIVLAPFDFMLNNVRENREFLPNL